MFFGTIRLFPSGGMGGDIATVWLSLRRSFLFAALACAALAIVAMTARSTVRATKWPHAIALGALFVLGFADPWLHASRYIKVLSPDQLKNFQLQLIRHWADSMLNRFPPPVRGIETDRELSNRPMTRGFGTLHGYHPVRLQRYIDLLDLYSQDHPQLGRLVYERFILAPAGKPPGREYERRAVEAGQTLWLRKPSLLYAYFPEEMKVAADDAQTSAAMGEAAFNPYRVSYTLDSRLAFWAERGSTPTARVVRYSPNRIDLDVSCDAARPLIVAEIDAPGWRWVLPGGGHREPARANYAFRAVQVPAGTSRLQLAYEPFSFRIGVYMTLFTVMALLATILAARGRHRSRD
jgi:hypothetical protein